MYNLSFQSKKLNHGVHADGAADSAWCWVDHFLGLQNRWESFLFGLILVCRAECYYWQGQGEAAVLRDQILIYNL